MYRTSVVVALAAGLAACSSADDWRETKVDPADMPFALGTGSSFTGNVDMTKSYDVRGGTSVHLAEGLSTDQVAFFKLAYMKAGPGRLYDMQSTERFASNMFSLKGKTTVGEKATYVVDGHRADAWRVTSDQTPIVCTRFVSPIDRAYGYDNSATTGFDTALAGIYCSAKDPSAAEIQELLDQIKLKE